MQQAFKRAAVAAAIVAGSFMSSVPVHSQQYPTKPVRVIVPFAPGGGSDITARQFSQKLSEGLGQQFIVDNRGGAGGLIGMEATAKAPPDGYTIMMMSASFSATSALNKPTFDPINSIIPVAEFGITPFVLTVHPSVPAKTTKELIALGRNTKGGLTYASTGVGSITHLSTELFMNMAKIKMVHVPYKSTGRRDGRSAVGAGADHRRKPAAGHAAPLHRQVEGARRYDRETLALAPERSHAGRDAARL